MTFTHDAEYCLFLSMVVMGTLYAKGFFLNWIKSKMSEYQSELPSEYLYFQDKFEREKEVALEKLRQEHQKEIHQLEQRFNESQLLNLEQR